MPVPERFVKRSQGNQKRRQYDSGLLADVKTALAAKDWPTALRLCEARLCVMPDDADAHRYLGQIHAACGDYDAALHAARRACELAPEDARTWSDLGRVHVGAHEWQKALRCFSRAMQVDAHYADGWHNLGTALKQLGDQERAFAALKRALSIDPTRADTWLAQGGLLVEAGQIEDAIGCFERAAKYDVGAYRARNRLAQELAECGQVAQAEALFRQSVARNPEDLEAWLGLGMVLEDRGESREALACYRTVLQRQPTHGMALGQYLSLARDDAGTAWVRHGEVALSAQGMPDENTALIGYGLAKYYDRRREYVQAAKAARQANAARRRQVGPLKRAALAMRIDRIITTCTAEFFSARRQYGLPTDQPVFIVGLPRSGTTLTEQILAAHPLLHGAGELPDLARLATQFRVAQSDAPWQAAMGLDQPRSLQAAQAYLDALHRGAPEHSLRMSDKSPLNFFHLAFVALLFPGARVIHCRRDPRDTALSIWMENFNADQRYATDFDDLAFFTMQYDRLMAHWRAVLPLPLLDVQYEDTVADVETQARRLMTFLDVPWDACCLDFHKSERAVQTPSRWQVRQPIYTRSVGRWRVYAEHLPELVTAFRGMR